MKDKPGDNSLKQGHTEILAFLELGSSRLNADMLSDKMEEDPEVFDIVWEIMTEDRYPVSMRAAWSISIFTSKHPSLVESRIPSIIALLPSAASKGVKRSLLKLLTMMKLPEEFAGFLFDYCFGIMESPLAETAHKAYAMTILYDISEQEPGLKPELVSLFETCLEEEPSGIRARGRILLSKLHRDLSLQ